MKKTMLFLFLLFAGLANAQNETSLKDIDELTFFGVDFSLAKVYGASETASQFKEAFNGINALFEREPKKYDVAKAFNAVTTINLAPSLALIDQIDATDLFTNSTSYSLSGEPITSHISKFDTGAAKGYGAVLIAELLNKGKAEATYTVVIFDLGTKEIVTEKQFTEKAGGFGLRNYWASSVYKTLKKAKKM